jgi:membrane protein DedA with SNARE-associated domain
VTLQDLVLRYGPAAVVLGTATEGDVSMILTGVMAHLGLLAAPVALAAGAGGAMLGDVVCYVLGRVHSRAILSSALYRRAAPFVSPIAARLGPWQIVMSRFVYGTRVATMVYWGAHDMPAWRFAIADAAGCLAWALLLGGLGFLASSSAETVLGRVRHAEMWLLAAGAVAILLVASVRTLYRRRARPGDPPSA